MALEENALTAIGTLAAAILTKLGWDKVQKHQAREANGDEPRLDETLNGRETVLMHVANRIHAVRDELNPRLTAMHTRQEIADLRFARLEADQLETKRALADAVREIREHIDKRQDKLEEKFDLFIERRRPNT